MCYVKRQLRTYIRISAFKIIAINTGVNINVILHLQKRCMRVLRK